VRAVIAEDSVLLRAGLARLLADGGVEVVAQVGDGPGLVAAVDAYRPDLAIVDVRMPPTHTDEGLRAALEVRERAPSTAILVLSQYVEERYAADLLAGGARGVGYLLKDRVADVGEFLAAVRRVGDGGAAIDPEVVAQLLGRRRRADPLDGLSARELECSPSWPRGAATGPSPSGWWSPRARSRSTSPASSPSSACPPPPATTAGSWRC
jgi:DNA-binding NarL/FixJ family response regulator